jgi:hypothetical protein
MDAHDETCGDPMCRRTKCMDVVYGPDSAERTERGLRVVIKRIMAVIGLYCFVLYLRSAELLRWWA